MALAQRLRERVRALEYPHVPGALSAHVTVSIGVATQLPGHAGRLSDLVASADRAMYLAKRHGRDRIEVAAPGNLP
ncbi:diguanylate cyclase [Thermomonas sp.]|uniref:diguanylate cyclase n=1 Tax=Thermomonas sp. TaxID=1971895 RepID=UPI0035AF243C